MSTRSRLVVAAVAGFLVLALSACGTNDASTAAAAADVDGPAVVIDDGAFTPEALTVQAGDTVTWVWTDGATDHNVVGDGFRSDTRSDGTFSHRLDEPGTYEYACTLHPNMTGTIEVTAAATTVAPYGIVD
jgi:plastocyanin